MNAIRTFAFGAIVGGIVFPLIAQASFLSLVTEIFGGIPHAEAEQQSEIYQKTPALEAQSSPDPDAIKSLETDLSINNEEALVPEVGPSGTAADVASQETQGTISLYIVHTGDTLPTIAKMFGVSVATIRQVNDLKKSDPIKVGQSLVILPFDGIEYAVKSGDTINTIAKKFSVESEDIRQFNEISDTELHIGDIIIIPGGEMVEEAPKPQPKPKTGTSGSSVSSSTNSSGYAYPIPQSIGRFVRGIQPHHKGVDIAAPIGTPIYAVTDGTALIAKGEGYNGGFGKYVVINDKKGHQELYAHMSQVIASPGQSISKGDLIGRVGSTGHSTGPHLHIEFHGISNPVASMYR